MLTLWTFLLVVTTSVKRSPPVLLTVGRPSLSPDKPPTANYLLSFQLSGKKKTELPFAAHLKKTYPNLLIGSVGIITDAKQANDILEQGKADVILIGRQLLRNLDWPLDAAVELGVAVAPAVQYER